jgi:hypothetical protein
MAFHQLATATTAVNSNFQFNKKPCKMGQGLRAIKVQFSKSAPKRSPACEDVQNKKRKNVWSRIT